MEQVPNQGASIADNPLLATWHTPFGVPPFAAIRAEHFEPALRAAMAEHDTELQAIATQREAPSFANTIAAFDCSGRRLSRIEAVYWNLTASQTSPELQAVQRTLAAPMAAHSNATYQHQGLFDRVQALYRQRHALGLDAPALRLLERTHLDFVRAGAQLEPVARARCAALTERLAQLHTAFAQNVLADEAEFALPLLGESDLVGLPDFLRASAAQAAAERGHPAGHVITLSRSLIVPFLTFSDRRDLREKAWRAWVSRGELAPHRDNRPVAADILRLRAEFAQLLGYANYADYVLADTMAGTVPRVNKLFDDVWPKACDALERERSMLQASMAAAGTAHTIEPWDWRYWAEKVRRRDFAIDEAELKPYFPLERMVQAAFDCAQRLFGIHLTERTDLALYHPDVKAWEVSDASGRPVGLFLHDNFARSSKRSGAWMSSFRMQTRHDGVPVLPIIVNNNNFAKGAPDEPTLLSFDDLRTLFHEFGHGLHGLLSNVTWERQSGTSVLRDFVELPSQLFEHWIGEPKVLERHARHWKTNEPIPMALVQRMKRAQTFGQGFETVRFLGSAIVDMRAHVASPPPSDVVAFEAGVLREIGLPSGVGLNHRLVHFQHLFSGSSYAAGYYVYLWAEVLDADAYDAFTEAGDPFDAKTARRLLDHVYSVGDSVDPQATYVAFRGRPATVEPLLRKRGLLQPAASA